MSLQTLKSGLVLVVLLCALGSHFVAAARPNFIVIHIDDLEIVCTVDFAASFAALTGQTPVADGRLDSFNVLDALLGKPGAKGRDHPLQQDNGSGNSGLRAGEWKLVRLKQRGKSQARVSQDERPLPAATHTLYRLTDDPGERTDVSTAHPEVLQRLTAQLDKLINDGRSRPAKQP